MQKSSYFDIPLMVNVMLALLVYFTVAPMLLGKRDY